MPKRDIVDPAILAGRNCYCTCGTTGKNGCSVHGDKVVEEKEKDNCSSYPLYPPYPPQGCYPPPPPPYPYPYPASNCNCTPEVAVNPCHNSIEAQIAKMSKKASIIRKMLKNLTQRHKPIIINIGGVQYNFGCYNNEADADDTTITGSPTTADEINYGDQVKEMLEYELKAIIAKIEELSAELTASIDMDETNSGTEKTVTEP